MPSASVTGPALRRTVESELEFRPMEVDDLDRVLAIESVSFPEPWPRAVFEQEIGSGKPAAAPRSWAVVAVLGGEVVGYLVAWQLDDAVHLGNLAVAEPWRRRGCGRALLRHLLGLATAAGAGSVTLEVRASNRAAIALYARHRFRPVGLRQGYYRGIEDALLMTRDM